MKNSVPSIGITLIVPSYNGIEKLKVTLPFLLNQSVIPSQYILILDGSTDGSAAWLKQQILPKNFEIISQPNAGRAAARNTGARHASGDILIFVDDDIKLPYNFIERHLELQQRYPISLISGDVSQDLSSKQNVDFCQFRRQQEALWKCHIDKNKLLEGFHFSTANLSINKSLFESLGCFDERLSDGEDFLFGILANEKGIPIRFDPSLVAYHCDYGDLEYFIKRSIQYAESKQQIFLLYPEYKEKYGRAHAKLHASSFLRKELRRFFRFRRPWGKLINSAFFRLIPRQVRFKVYDYIISSSLYFSLLDGRETSNHN